ncbi:TrkA family potassium uptake protein [bacterium]|jgi:trk system potassium uptake protein|nr:TrkA family potassium uptake protein [bacterium]
MKFGIIGLGRFGYQLALSLAEQGCEVLAIDKDEDLVDSISDKVTQAICLDVEEEETLVSIGFNDVDTAIVATGEAFAQSVFITALLKKHLEIPRVIARATNHMHENILKLVGADKVVVLERDMGIKLAHKLSIPIIDLVHVTNSFTVTQIKAPEKFVGKKIDSLKLIKNYHVSCIAVKKGDEPILVGPDYVILERDILLIAGDKKDIHALVRI